MTAKEKLFEAAKKHAERVSRNQDFRPYQDVIARKEKEFEQDAENRRMSDELLNRRYDI